MTKAKKIIKKIILFINKKKFVLSLKRNEILCDLIFCLFLVIIFKYNNIFKFNGGLLFLLTFVLYGF